MCREPNWIAKAAASRSSLTSIGSIEQVTAWRPGIPPSWIGSVSLSVDDPTILQAGMVVSVEPTFIFYDRVGNEAFSAIVGSNILITNDGAEKLNMIDPFLNT